MYTFWRASHEVEHRELLSWLDMHIRMYVMYLIAGGSVLVALAWMSSDDHLHALVQSVDVAGKLALGVALLSTLALGGGVYVLHLLWRAAIVYAQADQDYRRQRTAKEVHALRIHRGSHPQRSCHSTQSASDTTRNSKQ